MGGGRNVAVPGRGRTLLGFAAFGLFWGGWGGALPATRAHAGVSDGALRLALLCIGAGALASMRPAGVLLDRHGARVLPLALAVFAASAVLPVLASSGVALAGALLVLGARSGAGAGAGVRGGWGGGGARCKGAINAEGVRAEAASGRRLMNLAHAAFSATV